MEKATKPHRQEAKEDSPVDILIVDDLSSNLIVYRSILDELEQNLFTVSSGEEALKLVLQRDFAVILLDVNMSGMDGFETAAMIRKRRKSSRTPIIFLTAFSDEMMVAQGYASGAVDYLPTPVVPAVLQAKVRVFIELHRMRRQAAMQAEERARRTAAEAQARRSAFMVKAGEMLARPHNRTEFSQALARLPIALLADTAIVWLTSEEGRGQPEWAIVSEKEGEFDDISPLLLFPWLEQAMEQAVAANQPQIRAISKSVALTLPLSVQGQSRGALTLIRQKPEVSYQPDEVALAEEMVARAGLALENILLMEKIQEADRRKDEFLGMLAHELRNPLGPIRNAAELLRMIGPKEARINELRDIIDRQVAHMVRLIDDLLDATRLARGQILLRKERCSLSHIVRQTAEDYRSLFDRNNLRLEVDVPADPLWADGDPTRLVQIVGNLLHNAQKFTPAGGTVSVTLAVEPSGHAVINVSDNGIGIQPSMLPTLFETFRQAEQGLDRSRGGLGLGLSLARGLVKLHSGDIEAESGGPGKGACFTLRLPLDQTQETIESAEPPLLENSVTQKRILVIEDNCDTAESTRLLLGARGYEVRTAYSGCDGLKAAQDFLPQIVLCDIGLPGMDGYEVVRRLRQDMQLASAFVIALTGYGRSEDQRQAQEAGFDLHLTKPIDYPQLCRVLALAETQLAGAA